MILKNSFTPETRELFVWNYECWICQMNNWNCLHHILGRVSSSILNSAPLHNIGCHVGNGFLSRFEVKKKLLSQTYEYLKKTGYTLTDDDKLFMLKHRKYYI